MRANRTGGDPSRSAAVLWRGSTPPLGGPMLIPLLLSLATAPAPPRASAARRDDPPIKVWLNNDNVFQQGDRAKVKLLVADDGYVIVLRADADGRVRVLYPLDPTD